MSAYPVQLGLADPEFEPLPAGTRAYVPVIKNKAGELRALTKASPAVWERMTPVIELVGPRKPPLTYKQQRIDGWILRVKAAVKSRPFFLDTVRLNASHPVDGALGKQAALSAIHECANRRGLSVVPVLRVDREGMRAVDLVRDSAASGGRGGALRYSILRAALPPSGSHTSVLAAALKRVDLDVARADVLIDLGYLAADDEVHPDDLKDALDEVLAVGKWRSVVLLGSSMPRMLGGIVTEGSLGEIPRREWTLWSALKAQHPSRLPTYGDFAIQNPAPPSDEGGGISMRANIRYTLGDRTLVVRGKGPVAQAGQEQYRELCQQLVSTPGFAGAAYTWGDDQISQCAAGTIEPGAQDQWRGAGSSHHFRVVTEQIMA